METKISDVKIRALADKLLDPAVMNDVRLFLETLFSSIIYSVHAFYISDENQIHICAENTSANWINYPVWTKKILENE